MKKNYTMIAVLAFGTVIRLLYAYHYPGFEWDIVCFAKWADALLIDGAGNFYISDMYTDYPPGYLYVLGILSAIKHFFGLTSYTKMHIMVLKLPAIICDILTCGLIYKEAKEQLKDEEKALLAMSVYLFNPAVILNSSVWGQVDSVYTLCVLLMCIFLTKKKMFFAYAVYGIGLLIKPQMMIFTPVLLIGILDNVFLHDFSIKKVLKNLGQGLLVIAGMFVLILPFGVQSVMTQYMDTLGTYPLSSVNAYNFWCLLGLNLESLENTFFFLTIDTWTMITIVLTVAFSYLIYIKNEKNTGKYPLISAFVIMTIYMFTGQMHERYLYPAMVLLLLYYLYKPCKSTKIVYAGITILHALNTGYVLSTYTAENQVSMSPFMVLISLLFLITLCYFYYRICNPDYGTEERSLLAPLKPTCSVEPIKMVKKDYLLLLAIMLLYSCFALYDLGDRAAPETVHTMQEGDKIELHFSENEIPKNVYYYIAPKHNATFSFGALTEGNKDRSVESEIVFDEVFTWNRIALANDAKDIQFTLNSADASVIELVFTDEADKVITPLNASAYPALFDESQLFPETISFRNSMYFDEIYHGRTAYEYINGLTTYENTHPPLGKIFISLGVLLFGMNPFGWRIVGTLFGIFMLPFIYVFAKQIMKNSASAALTCFIFAFDFMHFVQTRIATIDVYITFFVILMYYFMYRYCSLSFYDKPLKKTLLPLGLCGISMGFGVACKWTGVYAGIGLAIIFFATLFQRYREYRYAKERPEESTNGVSHESIIKTFPSALIKTLLFCIVFFVMIPAGIYALSYIPFKDTFSEGFVQKIINNQQSMFSYHSELTATHPYSSRWYQWPTMERPVWYYSNVISENLREGISAFGNPFIWWIGIPAAIYQAYNAIKKKDKISRFLCLSYLAQYLPWIFISRATYAYHYFPSVPFVVLMIAYSLLLQKDEMKEKTYRGMLLIYAVAVFALFLLFYPVLAGQPADVQFVSDYLRWLNGWVLVRS